ncbi:MAG: hypothetical protein M0Z77_04270 [Thermoplasmatales archaeon]|nr:hypothetical protein [Candidatus Thermoplasmatota archaeon]MCL6003001.1 hypothetical protein [Candidatus Thermoplasmatota archaeon]MDA8054851.1 hypothetical protein [Thermoplasmatales archaeon]
MTEVKKRLTDNLVSDEEGFRMSTPLVIAKYKAERLKSKTMADLGAGIGVQVLNFALVSERVIAVENDVNRLEYLRRNAQAIGVTNIETIYGNVLNEDIIERVREVETIHSDPSRKRANERWSFQDLSPNPLDVIKSYDCDRLSFDLPAFFPEEQIPEGWEIEYISLSGELKRIGAYIGGVKRFGKSAIALPSEERVVENQDTDRVTGQAEKPLTWIYDLDGSLYYSNLIPEFLSRFSGLRLLHEDRQKTLVTSDKFLESAFLTKSYSVIDSVRNINDVRGRLDRLNAGKVILRYSMDPSKYYDERRNLERGLYGNETIYVFKFADTFYLADRVEKGEVQDK